MSGVLRLDGACATCSGTIGSTVPQCDPRERHCHVQPRAEAWSDKAAALWTRARFEPASVLPLRARQRVVLPLLSGEPPSQTSHTQTIQTRKLVMTSSCCHTCSCLMRVASRRVVMVVVCAMLVLLRNDHHLAARLPRWRVHDRSWRNIVFGWTSSRPQWQSKYSKALDPAQIESTRPCACQRQHQPLAQLARLHAQSSAEQPSCLLWAAGHVLPRDLRTVT